ncbi:MAG: aspartate dehydrogenase [Aestuariivita sp.]|nr:aspartate dehydrogenase [Aestuariivita sp.]
MKIGLIGEGAIGSYVIKCLEHLDIPVHTILVRPTRLKSKQGLRVTTAANIPIDTALMVDCAGHSALQQHGTTILERGIDLITVSVGALANEDLYQQLKQAAKRGGSKLFLATGAIGSLDCLRAAKVGGLETVTYIGRKPPSGWRGSPAENQLDLTNILTPVTHFRGNAREAALAYPKNANVAAAIALAGLGFDNTSVELIADPDIHRNIHQIEASGLFGTFSFTIDGNALPDNERSSALAAMSVVSSILQRYETIVI